MLELGQRARFAKEAHSRLLVEPALRPDHLDGDAPLQTGVLSDPDLTHPAGAEAAQYLQVLDGLPDTNCAGGLA